MDLLSLLLPVFCSIAISHPIQDRLKRFLNLTRDEQKYFSKIEPFCNHTQEAYTSLNISTRLYDFNDPTNAAIASIFSLKHQAVCVYFQCRKCGAVLAINFEFFDTGKKWTYGCSQSFTDELNVLQVNYNLVHFGRAFDSLPNTIYRLVSNNCITWTYDFYCKAVGQCIEVDSPVVGYLWRTFFAPTIDLLRQY